MTTTTMNISLPRDLKRFVRERAKSAQYSNPSDYVRSLIRDDQQRLEAEKLLNTLIKSYLKSHAALAPDELEKLRDEFWRRWSALRDDVAQAAQSLDQGKGSVLSKDAFENVKSRGRAKLARHRKAG